MSNQIVGAKYKMLEDSTMHLFWDDLIGFKEGDIITLIHKSLGDDCPLFRDDETGEEIYVGMKNVELHEHTITLEHKAGDTFIVVGAPYHFFDSGTEVTFTGVTRPSGSMQVVNSFGTKQLIQPKDLIPLVTTTPTLSTGTATFDDELDKAIEETVRTEHKPRITDNFTVAITEEALKDDIPFIIDAYYTANLSLRETGALLGVDEKTIRNRMKKHGVPTRTVSQALRAKYSL